MKKAVAVVIVLTIIVNLIGFGVLTPKSQAVAGAIITYVAAPAVIGLLSSVLGKKIADTAQLYSDKIEVTNRINSQAIQNGELIAVQCTHYTGDDTYSYKLVPVQGLSGETAEEVNFICDYMNNQGNINTAIAGFMLNNGDNGQNFYHGDIKAEVYEALSTDAVNAYTAYLEGKQREIDMSNFSSFMSELESAMGGVWAPDYEFSFVGPQPDVSLSGVSSYKNFTLDGFTFSTPMMFPGYVNGGYLNKAFCTTYAGDHDNNFAGTGFYYIAYNNESGTLKYMFGGDNNTVAVGLYFISNGELYITRSRNTGSINLANSDYADPFYNQNGVSGSLSAGVPFGFYYTTDTSRSFNYTDLMTALRPDDYFIQSEDIDVSVPFTSDELPVSAAMAAEIISNNPTLTIDENGNIVAADGITLAQLQQIADQIMNGQLQFEDFEEYLNYITALLMKANVDRNTQTDVINSLRAFEQQQTNALNQINSNIAALSTALTAAQEAELDLKEHEADIFTIEHTGLAEATAIVSGLPIIQQISSLFNMLYDPDSYTDEAPSFSFYWDSNKDGVVEKYTALDLSFLENPLTNENLEDKERFQNTMTVREFIQLIIITLCYIGFVFKVLRKLPSLIGGSESTADTGLQYQAAQRTELSRKGG